MLTSLLLAATLTSVQSGNWSDAATWDTATVPTEHDTVEIAEGDTVTYDAVSDEVIDLLTINGTLDFATDTDTRLTVDEAAVYGTWRMGTADDPIPNSVTAQVAITGQEEMIAVYSGTFLVHGAAHDHTWTRLSATAKRGAHRLKLKQAVDWRVGDQIVIASTSYEPAEAEVRTITAISDNRKVLHIGSALDYKHYGANREFAEVGLLSHNIQFYGDEEYDAGHIMFTGSATANVLGASFDTLGTYATLAQYPLHFHLVGDGDGSYIKQTSITNTSNRCITVHGTDNVVVRDNVAYNNKGHCYFLEDGVEENNSFIHNLGVYTVEGATLESDAKPATFWITNPHNTYKHNAAAGAEGFGFWFFLLDATTGLSTDSDIIPREENLKAFSHNTAHSNGRGITIDGEGFDSVYYMPEDRAVFTYTTAYKNNHNGIWGRGTNFTFNHATLLDNAVGATFAANNVTLTHALVIGETGNDSDEGYMPYKYGFTFYDGPVHVKHSTFKHFQMETDQLQAAVSIQPNNPYAMSPNSSFSDLSFYDAKHFYMGDVTRDGEIFAVLNNADTGDVLLPFLDFHSHSCTAESSWNVYICPEQDYGALIFTDYDTEPDELTVTRLDSDDSITLAEEGSSTGGRFRMNLPVGISYRLSSGNADGLKLYFYQADSSITLHIPYNSTPSEITDRGLVHEDWTYDSTNQEVVLTVDPNREYIIYQ